MGNAKIRFVFVYFCKKWTKNSKDIRTKLQQCFDIWSGKLPEITIFILDITNKNCQPIVQNSFGSHNFHTANVIMKIEYHIYALSSKYFVVRDLEYKNEFVLDLYAFV